MRIVFVGAVEFSLHCLRAVIANGGNIVAVITLKPENARSHADYADLSDVAENAGIPVFYVKHINEGQNIELIASLKPDVIFVLGWSQIISSSILNLPPRGCIGSHPALLPRNRGRHPLIWALVEGLKESGLTFLYLDEGADSGDILWQRPFQITLEDDAFALYAKIQALASLAVAEFLPQLESGTAPRSSQDHANATYWRKRSAADGEIHWDSSSFHIYNLIRGLAKPYVGAHTYLNGSKMIVWKSQLMEGALHSGDCVTQPGTVLCCGDDPIVIRTGNGALLLKDYYLPENLCLSQGDVLGASP